MRRRISPNGDHQPDLFAASFADIPVRDQRDTMERPFFSLAKKPRLTPIEYKVGNVWVEVSANPKFGMATIWDADILIWASTQITEALDRGLTPSRMIKFHPYNLLNSIRRTTGGADYTRLRAALDRLTHTAVRTNIRAEGKKKFASFHWLESWTETIDERTGEPSGMTITLPDWLYSGVIERGGVLTIHEDYFLLTGGIERWLYRVPANTRASRRPAGVSPCGNSTRSPAQSPASPTSPSTSATWSRPINCPNTNCPSAATTKTTRSSTSSTARNSPSSTPDSRPLASRAADTRWGSSPKPCNSTSYLSKTPHVRIPAGPRPRAIRRTRVIDP